MANRFSVSLFVAGTAAAPAAAFQGDTGTGMWSPAASKIAFSLGGAEAARLDSSGLTLVVDLLARGATLTRNGATGPVALLACRGAGNAQVTGRRSADSGGVDGATADGDVLFQLIGQGHSGSAFRSMADARVIQDGAHGGTTTAAKWSLRTMSASAGLQERLVVTATETQVKQALTVAGKVGFYGAEAAAKPTVTGSRGSNAALASLLTALAGLGLLTDSSS